MCLSPWSMPIVMPGALCLLSFEGNRARSAISCKFGCAHATTAVSNIERQYLCDEDEDSLVTLTLLQNLQEYSMLSLSQEKQTKLAKHPVQVSTIHNALHQKVPWTHSISDEKKIPTL